jgi:hypothetical protein
VLFRRRLTSALLAAATLCVGNAAHAFSLAAFKWEQPQYGAPVTITYSFSNLFDGSLLDSQNVPVPTAILRPSVEQALSLWALYAPLHFVELADSGPLPSDQPYSGIGLPQIRIGHHPIDGFGSFKAHAYYPGVDANGIPGDLHFDVLDRWDVLGTITYPDVLGAAIHELGHSLGLDHSTVIGANMFPLFPRMSGLGTGYLTDDDIAGIQGMYGAGIGSVTPIPAPPTLVLMLTSLAALGLGRKSR